MISGIIGKEDDYLRRDYMREGREGKATLSDQSSIWHLESYRSLLISQMSREDLVSGLKICSLPEVFADP